MARYKKRRGRKSRKRSRKKRPYFRGRKKRIKGAVVSRGGIRM